MNLFNRANGRWLLALLLAGGSVSALWVFQIENVKAGREGNRDSTSNSTSFSGSSQDSQLDYSKFLHSSQRHVSLPCTACHTRAADNAATPKFPGHDACTKCHLAQFVTPNVPMCVICHSDVKSASAPLKAFPGRFDENFNVKFDHAQHMSGSARPQNGCQSCHGRTGARGMALSIPVGLNAHNGCYSCHTPASKSAAGKEIASCGVCHDQKPYNRTSTNAPAFRLAFSHAQHGRRERLDCVDCHRLSAGLPQSRQVSSPSPTEHFPTGRSNCATCHNGKRSFGGDLGFKDCVRCHTGSSFGMGSRASRPQ